MVQQEGETEKPLLLDSNGGRTTCCEVSQTLRLLLLYPQTMVFLLFHCQSLSQSLRLEFHPLVSKSQQIGMVSPSRTCQGATPARVGQSPLS